MLLLKSICLPDPFFFLYSVISKGLNLCEMVAPSWFHVHAKPSFTTLTMNDTLAEEVKEEGGGSSPHRGSGNGGMPRKGEIWWTGLSHSHKQHLGHTYQPVERGSSKFPTTAAGLLFLIL